MLSNLPIRKGRLDLFDGLQSLKRVEEGSESQCFDGYVKDAVLSSNTPDIDYANIN